MAETEPPYSDELLAEFAAAPHAAGVGAGVTQVPMYEVSEDLAPAARAFEMQKHFDNMRRNGYTVIEPTAETIELADKIRAEALLMMAEQRRRPDRKEGDGQLDQQAPKLLGRGALQEDGRTLYERFLMLPQQAILAEYMCGAGFLLSQITCSYKNAKGDAALAKVAPGGVPLPLHADQSWMPAPFPEHNMLLTTCFVTDDGYETRDGGATVIVPNSHLLKRAPPTTDERLMEKAYEATRPIIAKKGSLVCWDGSVWHAGGFRKVPEGERVVMHTTFCRLYVRPVENYKLTVDDRVLARNPPLLASMCGRHDFLDHTGAYDGRLLVNTYATGLAGRNSMVAALFGGAAKKSRL